MEEHSGLEGSEMCSRRLCPWPELMSPDQYSFVKDAHDAIEPLWFTIWDNLFPGVLRPASIWATDVVVQNANDFYDANAHTTVEQYMREHEDEMPAEFS